MTGSNIVISESFDDLAFFGLFSFTLYDQDNYWRANISIKVYPIVISYDAVLIDTTKSKINIVYHIFLFMIMIA